MRLVITFGPGYEPIDQARRLTNMSTGRLGTQLANAFTAAGWNVHCLRGEGASYLGPLHANEVETFTTNDDLDERLERIGRWRQVDAIFHVAAIECKDVWQKPTKARCNSTTVGEDFSRTSFCGGLKSASG